MGDRFRFSQTLPTCTGWLKEGNGPVGASLAAMGASRGRRSAISHPLSCPLCLDNTLVIVCLSSSGTLHDNNAGDRCLLADAFDGRVFG